MATDDQNKDREEDDFFGDDEDFGLPELDYEALDDDADDSLSEEPESDDSPEEIQEVTAESEDDFSDMDSAFDDIDDDDIPDMVDDAELEAEMGADIETEEMDGLYEEESFGDFEASAEDLPDDGDEIPDSVFDSDVLDEDEFKQFEKELMDSEGDLSDLDSFNEDDYAPTPIDETGGKGKFARVVIIGIIIFSALGTLFWFLSPSLSGDDKPEVAEVKKPTPKPVEKPVEEKEDAEANDPEQKPVDNTTEKPTSTPKQTSTRPAARPVATTPGEVNSLSGKTGNFYVVIASFVDGDMAMDYAQKLAGAGKSPSIIPPFGKAITHRVAIQGFGTLAQAQGALSGLKPEYGQDIWVLKY